VSQKKGDTILLSISLLNIDRFSRFFHRRTQLKICNKIINKDPTSPQMCCYTTLWNVLTRQCTGAQGTRDNRAAATGDAHIHLPDLWPPNSPDLNPVNYKICGVIQDRVYQKKVKDVNELRERLVEVWAGLQQNVIDDAIDQWHRRLRACVRARGGHFEYLLWLQISCLGYGSWSSLKICWFIVKQDIWFRLLLVF